MSYQRVLDAVAQDVSPVAYSSVAVVIFLCVSFTFFFPLNPLIPLDRRSCALIGATACYLSRVILFPSDQMNLVEAIDFDVLVLLAGIMAVNFIVVHQAETKRAIARIQQLIQINPRHGFWITSLVVFLTSPFLTNDGVCLLFVEPILNAFESRGPPGDVPVGYATQLRKSDAFYFLISLACSSNIGSALTYTGNPQNMLVAEDAISVMPPIVFLLHMLIPSVASWIVTTLWIERCWFRARCAEDAELSLYAGTCLPGCIELQALESRTQQGLTPNNIALSDDRQKNHAIAVVGVVTIETTSNALIASRTSGNLSYRRVIMSPSHRQSSPIGPSGGSPVRSQRSLSDGDLQHYSLVQAPLSSEPERSEGLIRKIIHVVAAPFPYAMCLILAMMIALIFVDLISIAALVVCAAVVMVMTTVLGNHWQGRAIWSNPEEMRAPLTADEKIKNTNEFFESLFNSIDYSLLLIFTGLFIVLENISSTGIPRFIWSHIVGDRPFKNIPSVIGICFFVLFSSQFLGNVPVIQLARPNVEYLGDAEKRYAWAILSFVATIGGNLTITGSAANIIVAEKANRLDPSNFIDFFNHYKICFWITILCCIFGVMFISCTVFLQDSVESNW